MGCGGVDWESPSVLPSLCCGVWWIIPCLVLPLWCGLVGGKTPLSPRGVGFGGVEFGGPSRVGSPGGREASLVRQTIFCGRRFCSETLRCPFRCFGRPWRFLLGNIQYRAIKSVLMTSTPPIIDYTLCHILYTIYSRVYTIYYRLYSVYMVYLYTIARPLKGGNQVLHGTGPEGPNCRRSCILLLNLASASLQSSVSQMVPCELLINSSLRQLRLALNLIPWHIIQNTIVCYSLPYHTTAY